MECLDTLIRKTLGLTLCDLHLKIDFDVAMIFLESLRIHLVFDRWDDAVNV
ncbi:MAG: hypothetical protein QXL67_04670 [Candidatus Bathyarchaeia archaeon]